ncbi:DUF4271 domain-containing protein [Flavobacterium akiainvivens]|nr:DUF4271 domain-containing protein [Flavobacterium akiainvivens]
MELHERIIGSKDWATVLFVLAFTLVAVNRNVFAVRFAEFSKLGWSNKYTKIYKDSANMQSWFTISLFLVQVISFAFLLQFVLSSFGLAGIEGNPIFKTDWRTYIQLFTLLFVFILAKYLVEKIIATSFDIEEFSELFNLQKVNYRAYIGLLLLPVNVVLFYNDNINPVILYIVLVIIVIASIASYIFSLRNYQNLILGKIFYFILYLCALEIAPYYFMYYWFTKA